MAYNRNGQPYPGQYSQYQASPSQQQQQYPYSQHPQQPQQGQERGRPNYEGGEDPAYGRAGGGVGTQYPGGTDGRYVRMPDDSDFAGSGGLPPLPVRNQSASAGGHSYQARQGAAQPNAHSAYNPQHYAPPSQPGAAIMSSPTTGSPTLVGHQPYNPAAYQTSDPPQAEYGFPLYEAAAARRQQSLNNQTAPDLPPRPWQLQQPQQPQAQAYQISATGFPHSYSDLPQSPLLASSTYTPPRPPPPPSGLSAYYSDANAPPQSYGQDQYRQPSARPSTGSTSQHHRLPSIPQYQGSGDYATPPLQHGTPTSPTPPYSTPQRSDTGGRHPQARPLPAEPQSPYPEYGAVDAGQGESFGYDAILEEVEAAVMGRPTPTDRRSSPSKPERLGGVGSMDSDPLFSHRGSGSSRTNGMLTPEPKANYGAHSDESDAEAAAGLAAMRMAEEQDAADRAWRGNSQDRHGFQAPQSLSQRGSQQPHGPLPPVPSGQSTDSDSDQIPIDMDTYGGGMPGNVNYHYGYESGGDTPRTRPQHSHSQSENSIPYSDLSSDTVGTPAIDYYMPGEESIHPFPSFARTDAGDTGGLQEAGQLPRKMSFDDGDESTLYEGYDQASSGGVSPSRDDGSQRRSNSRPLPTVPRRGAVDYQPQSPDDYVGYSPGGETYDSYGAVQKAKSVGSHSHTPQVVPPGRSVTDAEQRRRPVPGRGIDQALLSPNSASAAPNKLGEIVLPSLPAGKRKRFVPSKLTLHDFKRCPEPWALSALLAWLQEMAEGEVDLKENLIVDGLVVLFTNKVPTMNTADAESLSALLVEQMFDEGALLHDEEWVKFGDVPMSGVVFQLTGTGCYSSKLHTYSTPGRCYSHHCMRTLKKVDLATQSLAPERKVEDWATFYELKREDIADVDKKEIERQNNLHEIVTSEDVYMDQLDVLRVLYRDGLRNSTQPIMSKNRIDDFIKEVFGKIDQVKQANEDYLLPQLKYRQGEQGPWIKGFSDIFREWIRKAKAAYIEYAAHFPSASLKIRKEAERNVLFRQFLDQMRENERSKRLGWDTYLKSPITRLQRYSLLLATVHKHTLQENDEKRNLTVAIEEIKNVTLECDARVAEMQKRSDLMELASKLKLRPGMEKVQLNLNHLGREIIFRGDLQRKGSNRISWVETHAILFDHFMVLAKPVQQRDAVGGLRHEVYDVSKLVRRCVQPDERR